MWGLGAFHGLHEFGLSSVGFRRFALWAGECRV